MGWQYTQSDHVQNHTPVAIQTSVRNVGDSVCGFIPLDCTHNTPAGVSKTPVRNTKDSLTGFTLIEMLVSLALFAAVSTVATSTLLALVDASAKSQNIEEIMSNMSFVLDSISREIRTGDGYYCANSLPGSLSTSAHRDCPNGATMLSVVEGGSSLTGDDDGGSNEGRIAYRFIDGRIERRIESGDWVRLSGESVTITDMEFIVTGTDTFYGESERTQPRVLIYIAGEAGNLATVDTTFTMQTTLTQRARDIGFQ